MVAQGSRDRSAQSGPFTSSSKTVAVDPASIPANSSADQSIAFAGAQPGDSITVRPQVALAAGLISGQAVCVVAGTVLWRVANCTVAAIDQASVSVKLTVSSQH